jgi:pseudouridine-5'-phosphate glycosidase
MHWRLGRHSGLVVANPPAQSLDVEPLIEAAVAEARERKIRGQDVTPFVLAHLHRASGGRTIDANRRLAADNAALAAEVAVAYSQMA